MLALSELFVNLSSTPTVGHINTFYLNYKNIFKSIVIFSTFAFAGCFSSFGILFSISVLSNKIYIKVIVCVHLRVDDINISEAEEQYLS